MNLPSLLNFYKYRVVKQAHGVPRSVDLQKPLIDFLCYTQKAGVLKDVCPHDECMHAKPIYLC